MVSEDSTSKVVVLPVRAPQAEHHVECGLLLDVVVSEGTAVLELLVDEDEPLLVRGDAFLILDLGRDVVNGIRFHLHVLAIAWLYEHTLAPSSVQHHLSPVSPCTGKHLLYTPISSSSVPYRHVPVRTWHC
jgi:hypothetical protein